MRDIEYNGKRYTPLEFQEFIAAEIPEKHKRIVEITLASIALHKKSINASIRGIEQSIHTLILLSAVEPMLQPLCDYLKAEVDSLK